MILILLMDVEGNKNPQIISDRVAKELESLHDYKK